MGNFIPKIDGIVRGESYGPMFIAKYDTTCSRCGDMIEVGDEARMHAAYDHAVHERCKDAQAMDEFTGAEHKADYKVRGQRKNNVCGRCWLEHPPGDCDMDK